MIAMSTHHRTVGDLGISPIIASRETWHEVETSPEFKAVKRAISANQRAIERKAKQRAKVFAALRNYIASNRGVQRAA